MIWVETIINGVLYGGLYGLLGVGLALAVGVMRVVNLSHGEFIVLSAFLGVSLVRVEKGRLATAGVLLFGFLAAVYAVRDASNYVYYTAIPASVCLGALCLYSSSFLTQGERRAIGAFFGRARALRSVFNA